MRDCSGWVHSMAAPPVIHSVPAAAWRTVRRVAQSSSVTWARRGGGLPFGEAKDVPICDVGGCLLLLQGGLEGVSEELGVGGARMQDGIILGSGGWLGRRGGELVGRDDERRGLLERLAIPAHIHVDAREAGPSQGRVPLVHV